MICSKRILSIKSTIDAAEWLTLGCAEAAIRETDKGGFSELFALGPSDFVPSRIDQMIWLSAMFKIDHYVLAVSALDAKGNYAKKAYYNPMCYTNPWFEGYGDLGKTALCAAKYAKKKFSPDVVVRYPVSYATKHIGTDEEKVVNDRLYDVLKKLVRGQYQWQIIDENETAPNGVYVIEITDDGDFSADKIMSDVEKNIVQSLYVTENGQIADELMIRKYDDGSFALLDLKDSDIPRDLVICSGDAKSRLTMPGRGHVTSDDKICVEYDFADIKNANFNIELSKNNSLRCILNEKKSEFTFNVEEELKDINLAIRNYYFDGEITLDGAMVKPSKECTSLTKGLNELYLSTDKFTLSKGKHKISTSVAPAGEYYLPTCFVCGNFAADREFNLRKMPKVVGAVRLDQTTLPQYVGGISYMTDIEIPTEPCLIKFDSAQLYTTVNINGHFLGGQLSGYSWDIPEEYLGTKVNLKICQYTSIGPIFGEYEEVINEGSVNSSVKAEYIPGKYKKCGITNMRFTKKI